MNKQPDHRIDDDDAVEQLFRMAQPRPSPPAADMRDLRDALHDEWYQQMTHRRWRRAGGGLAFAASILVAIGAFWLSGSDGHHPNAQDLVAAVDRVQGIVVMRSTIDGESVYVDSSTESLPTGWVLETRSQSRLAMRLDTGGSLRLDENTRLTLTNSRRFTLDRGRVYFDSGGIVSQESAVEIQTSRGVVYDVGTQFSVRVTTDGHVQVSVREGRVNVVAESDRFGATAGERLTLAGSNEIRHEPISANGDEWRWSEQIAPSLDLEGRTLLDVLKSLARETGRELRFTDAETASRARSTILHGSVEMDPMQALAELLASTDFRHEVKENKIVISLTDIDL